MAIVQFRVDDDIKKKATELFESLGIDLSTALRSFLRRSIVVRGFPYPMIINDTIQGTAVSSKREDEVKALLNKLSEIEDDEFNNALEKMNDLSDEDEYGRIVLAKINEEIRLARDERRAKDGLLRDDRH